MRTRSFRPQFESLDERSLPSLTLSGTYPVADNTPFAVETGDFNGDGRLDLATRSSNEDNGTVIGEDIISVLLGAGDGSFGSATLFPVYTLQMNRFVDNLLVGDFNGDGNADLMTWVSEQWTESPHPPYSGEYTGIDVFFGDGNGSLYMSGISLVDVFSNSVLVADANADGRSDLVLFGYHYNASGYLDTSPLALFGNSDGSFSTSSITPVVIPPMPAPDFNGDGYGDVVTAAGGVGIQLGRADGSFLPTIYFSNGHTTYDVAVGDFNSDGRPDVATANPFAASASVLLNDGKWPSPDAPTLQVTDPTVTEGNSGTTNAIFTVSLSTPATQPVTVNFATANGSAIEGGDNLGASGTLTFAPGETEKTVSVAVLGDQEFEPNETFYLLLSNASGALIADHGLGTIVNDDTNLTIRINDATVTEGNSGTTTAVFTVSLSAPATQTVTVNYATDIVSATAGSDYQAASGTLTFAPGETTKTINVVITGDRLAEPSENFVVNLSNATNVNIADGQSVGTILDNEPRISIGDVTKKEGNGKKTTLFTFTVTLSVAYDLPVTMSFQTVNGTATTGDNDYVAKSGTLTFAPGETIRTISIEVKADNRNEAGETFYLDLYGLSTHGLFTKSRGIGTILNDD